jgi:hypothetical protein
MNYFEHTTKSGKLIKVWDDLIPIGIRSRVFLGLRQEQYPLSYQNDTGLKDFEGKFGFGKPIETKDFMKLLLNEVGSTETFPITSYLNRCKVDRCWINVYTGYDVNRYHTDESNSEHVSVLYYANLAWDLEWDGGTIFRSDDLSEVEFVSDYKPGRIVMFDSSIPHKIMQTSHSAHHYRFTVNSVFKNYNLKK